MFVFARPKNPWEEEGSSQTPNVDTLLREGQKKFRTILNKKPSKPNFSLTMFKLLSFAVMLLWFATGFYVVQPDEEGVVLRFGKYHRTAHEGLNYRLPFPLEKVTVVKVTLVNREEIGFRTTASRSNNATQRNVSEESTMLTGNENIVDIHCEVQWRISHVTDYLFNLRDQLEESTVKDAAESAVREVIGRTPMSDVLTGGRERIEVEAKHLLQEILDSYPAGVEVVRLQLLKADPPAKVIDAFRDVQTARANKEQEINSAYAYRNDILPRARGEVQRILEDAEAYQQEILSRAEGETNRFTALYNEYRHAKEITRKRIYIETLQDILKQNPKIIVDNHIKGLLPHLPLSPLLSQSK